MESIFNHNLGSSVVHFYPEEIASARTLADTKKILTDKLISIYERLDPQTLVLTKIDSRDPQEFWKSYMRVQSNWILGATRIDLAVKKIIDQGCFWYLTSDFNVKKSCSSDCNRRSIRDGFVLGNVFFSEQEALAMKQKILAIVAQLKELEKAHPVPEQERAPESTVFRCFLVMGIEPTASEKNGSVTDHYLRICYEKADRVEVKQEILSNYSFESAEYAAQACFLIENLFQSNGISFKSI